MLHPPVRRTAERFPPDTLTVLVLMCRLESQRILLAGEQRGDQCVELRFADIRRDVVGVHGQQLIAAIAHLPQGAFVDVEEAQGGGIEHEYAIERAAERALELVQLFLVLVMLLLDTCRYHQLPQGRQQGPQKFDQCPVVSRRPVGDAHQGDHFLAMMDRDAQECIQCRLTFWQPAAARIMTGIVGDDGLATGQGRTEQRLEVVKLHPLRRVGLIEGTGGIVPRDVGDGIGLR